MKKLNLLNNKSGVIFGMDARIALVIVSIISAALAVNKLSLRESQKIKDVTLNMTELHNNIMNYYKTYHTDLSELHSNLGVSIYTQDQTVQDQFFGPIQNLKYDPWGNEWEIKVFSAVDTSSTVTVSGEQIDPKCIVIFSSGADKYSYLGTNYSATTYDACVNNTGLPADLSVASTESDDYFYKFTTIGFEIEAHADAAKRLSEIKDALILYAQAQKNARIQYCNDLDQATADADALCDRDTSGTYEQSELDNANFYPKSTTDVTAAVYGSDATYDSTNSTHMGNLMSILGLPSEYKEDMLGRTLVYDSNVSATTAPTYYASIKYSRS